MWANCDVVHSEPCREGGNAPARSTECFHHPLRLTRRSRHTHNRRACTPMSSRECACPRLALARVCPGLRGDGRPRLTAQGQHLPIAAAAPTRRAVARWPCRPRKCHTIASTSSGRNCGKSVASRCRGSNGATTSRPLFPGIGRPAADEPAQSATRLPLRRRQSNGKSPNEPTVRIHNPTRPHHTRSSRQFHARHA